MQDGTHQEDLLQPLLDQHDAAEAKDSKQRAAAPPEQKSMTDENRSTYRDNRADRERRVAPMPGSSRRVWTGSREACMYRINCFGTPTATGSIGGLIGWATIPYPGAIVAGGMLGCPFGFILACMIQPRIVGSFSEPEINEQRRLLAEILAQPREIAQIINDYIPTRASLGTSGFWSWENHDRRHPSDMPRELLFGRGR
jgi:hypothetical protein